MKGNWANDFSYSYPWLILYSTLLCISSNFSVYFQKKTSSPHLFQEKYARETSNFFCAALSGLGKIFVHQIFSAIWYVMIFTISYTTVFPLFGKGYQTIRGAEFLRKNSMISNLAHEIKVTRDYYSTWMLILHCILLAFSLHIILSFTCTQNKINM